MIEKNNNIQNIIKRVFFAYAVIIAISIIIISRIIIIQFINPPNKDAGDISIKTENLEPKRGSILSSDGKPLAISIPYYQIRFDCLAPQKHIFDKNIGALSKELARLYKNKSASKYKTELIKARKEGRRYKLVGHRIIDFSELTKLKTFPIFCLGANRGGLIVEPKNSRKNTYGRLAYRTIGYINSQGAGVGIEESFDYYLKGKAGKQKIQRVLGGEWRPINVTNDIEPENGFDIRTTLDIEIQETTENALKGQLSKSKVFEGATVIVMDVETGAIRAIVNLKKKKNGDFDESFNYAIGQPSEPGSTFKLATLIALLEDKHITLNSIVNAENGIWKYKGHTYTDVNKGLKNISVLEAFRKSSNVAFTKLVVKHYGDNEKAFVDRIINMKITDKLNLDIKANGITRMLYPTEKAWNKLTLPSMAIGYAIDITPLHTLMFYNAVANNGTMMKPYFIETMEKNGKIITEYPPQEIIGSICSKKTLREAQKALIIAANNNIQKKGSSPKYLIAGKTGTARILLENGKYIDKNGYKKHQASFAGYFPAKDPKYSIIVMLYTEKTKSNFYGGAWATPVFRTIADELYSTHYRWEKEIDGNKVIPKDNPHICGGRADAGRIAIHKLPMQNKPEIPKQGWVEFKSESTIIRSRTITIDSDKLHNVVGMGLKDAIYLLENEGYKVKFKGYGRVVKQSPKPGARVKKNQVVNITLSPNIKK